VGDVAPTEIGAGLHLHEMQRQLARVLQPVYGDAYLRG